MTELSNGLESISCHHEGLVLEGQLAVPRGQGPHPNAVVRQNDPRAGDVLVDEEAHAPPFTSATGRPVPT